MMVRLSNGTRLALPDDIDGEMLAAHIEAAEADIERMDALKREQESVAAEMSKSARRGRK